MRTLLPKLLQNCLRTARIAGQHGTPRLHRTFYKPSWYLPGIMHRGEGPRSLLRDMDNNMRNMERFMDEMFSPSLYRACVRTGKELQVTYNDKKYELKLDVSAYKPEDIEVKLTGDTLTITGHYEGCMAEHGGVVKKSFERQFMIPENVETETVESVLTQDGHLVISGKVSGADAIPERKIDIKKELPPDPKNPEKIEE